MSAFAERGKGNAFFGPQHATHQINAMLNYCYTTATWSRPPARQGSAGAGLSLPVGYLHSNKKGRNSRDLTQLLLHKASLPAREIEEAAEWMVGAIVRCAATVPPRAV